MSNLDLLSQEAEQESGQQTSRQTAPPSPDKDAQLASSVPPAQEALSVLAPAEPQAQPAESAAEPSLAATSTAAVSAPQAGEQLEEPPLQSPASSEEPETPPGQQGEVVMQRSRTMIAAETEAAMVPLLGAQSDAALAQWLDKLQGTLADESKRHKEAQRYLKQVDMERDEARRQYRDDQRSKEKQEAWKGKVTSLKQAQATLRATREAYYKATAAVDVVMRETALRAGKVLPAMSKRKRQAAPEEGCPYCSHTYTVRDGLSSKTDPDGERLHLRKCQCREKTPPCRNCPKCKDNVDIMSLTDIQAQFSACQLKFRCEICSCKCPGAGKWVENDDTSRQQYAQRTSLRHGQLQQLGWGGSISVSATFGPSPVSQYLQQDAQPQCNMKRPRQSRRTLKRLPQDIRHQLEQLQVPPELLANPKAAQQQQAAAQSGQHAAQLASSMSGSPVPSVGAAAGAETLVLRPGGGGVTASLTPMPAMQHAPLPVLPNDVVALVDEVFAGAAGPAAAAAVRNFLQAQRVTALSDLQYLELPWLQEALVPVGVTPLLLNKFLGVARRRTDVCACT